MNHFLDKYWNTFFWILSAILFVFISLRAFFIPFSHDETATFFFYVQSDNFLPYSAHVYTNNHVLNSALTNLCYHLFGSHRFILRLPNLFAFLILCIGIFKHFKYLKNYPSKIITVSFFLLTYNFLDFFELCRGYGLSIGFMTLGMAYVLNYFESKKIKYLLYLSIYWQLALAANLILVVVLLVIFTFIFLFQLKNKLLFNFKTLLINCLNLICLIYWIKFSFFYKEQGKLDYGVGDNYWIVTFKTLILFLFGTDALWIQVVVIVLFLFILFYLLFYITKLKFNFGKLFSVDLIYPLLLISIILSFYILKKLVNVNYPEDRTGLFFYLFFGFSLVFFVDKIQHKIATIFSTLLLFLSLSIFGSSLNFTHFSSYYYHTMPKSIYNYLKSEQLKNTEQFTIGGNPRREMNFTFLNYRGNSILNPMDDNEQMQMNCDYYYALKYEKPFYQVYYDEIMFDENWAKVLLKRKEKIKHINIYQSLSEKIIKGNYEYFELKKISDTAFVSNNPIELEAKLTFNKVPKPFRAFLVFSFNDSNNVLNCYKRVPLNWLADDLNAKSKTLKLTTSNLPNKVRDLIVYIWNIDKKEIDITFNSLKIYQLSGKGVNLKIPESYYPSSLFN